MMSRISGLKTTEIMRTTNIIWKITMMSMSTMRRNSTIIHMIDQIDKMKATTTHINRRITTSTTTTMDSWMTSPLTKYTPDGQTHRMNSSICKQ